MIECNNYDELLTTQEYDDLLMQDYIDNNRMAYRQEWQDYMDYIENDNWRNGYDL